MVRVLRPLAALLPAWLAGCAGMAPHAGPDAGPDTAFVVIGAGGAASARVVTRAASCPNLRVDGREVAMSVRVPHGAIPVRSDAPPAAAGAPSGAVLACELPLAPGVGAVSLGGRALPVPKAGPRRIVVIGDTGCRLKKPSYQDCNDPQAYPFAQVALSAAAWKPDLVIHVGDYHYREDPGPLDSAGKPRCAGSPWGYGWDAWDADFFGPGRALLQAAPMVAARGNHESCARAGQGYARYLDPRPYLARNSCDWPADDHVADYGPPYAVPLGDGAQLVVLDTAGTSWRGLPQSDPRRAIYAAQRDDVAVLARGARYNIAVTHHPLLAFGAETDRQTGAPRLFGGDRGLLDAFGDRDPLYWPREISLLLSGHVHLWEQLSFSSAHPTQFVSGFSGTEEDTTPLPAAIPPGQAPAPGAIVETFSSWVGGFGFMGMERTGADSWTVTVYDRDGKARNRCTVKGRKSACELAQVR